MRDAISEIQVLQLPDGGGLAMKVQLVSRDKALALAMKIKRMGDADPADPSKQSINTKIYINAVEGGKLERKVLVNGKPLEREGAF